MIASVVDTGKILMKNGKVCTACCFLQHYSADDCCCYLNPYPSYTVWSAANTYSKYDIVQYNSNLYWSRGDSNKNHVPTSSLYWSIYTSCNNSAWNSISGFGGLGRTPQCYTITLKYEQTRPYPSYIVCGADTYQNFYSINPDITATLAYSYQCIWYANVPFTQYIYNNGVLTAQYNGTYQLTLDLSRGLTVDFGESRGCYFDSSGFGFPGGKDMGFTNCSTMKSQGMVINHISTLFPTFVIKYTFSFGPSNCSCVPWSSSALYGMGDCVTYNTKIYIYCSQLQEPNHPPESNATYACESNFWRLA